jgi:beta-glucosidase
VQIPAHPAISTTYLQPPLGSHNPGISTLDPTPLFAFGHGLTAASIDYESLRVVDPLVTVDGTVRAVVTVRNRGAVDAVEVVQLYQHDDIAQVARPSVQLVAFARIAIPAGAQRNVEFRLSADLFAFAGVAGGRIVEPGTVTLSAGRSAADRPVAGTVELVGEVRALAGIRTTRAEWTLID